VHNSTASHTREPARIGGGADGRPASPASHLLQVGDLLIDVERERVTRGVEDIPLPNLSFNLLFVLLRRAPDFVSVRALMDEVWPGLVVGVDAVSQRIKLLRVALGDDAKQPKYIAGARGKGYRMAVPVVVAGREPRSDHAALEPSRAGQSPTGSRQRVRGIALTAAGVALAALIAAGFLWHGGDSPLIAPPGGQRLRLAVLPFENLSPDPTNAFFGEGLHEEVLSALADSAPGIEVISRTTMSAYRNRGLTVRELAKSLNCTHVLEGSVRREGTDVRVTLQLIDARTDEHVWSQSYDRKLVHAITLQAEIAAEVASRLATRLESNRNPPGAWTTDPIAHDLYLKVQLARQRLNPAASSLE
jgi:TolB-like protein/DNA-binding winged helix-turn-helix (wHTH) protein